MHLLYVCRKCGLQNYGMLIIVCTKKGAKGFASQGQRTLFFKLSVKKQSRHFYHIKQSGAFNRYVTGRKAAWTSWPVFLWEKLAGPEFLFFAMVIIMLEILNGDIWSKAGFRPVKMLPYFLRGLLCFVCDIALDFDGHYTWRVCVPLVTKLQEAGVDRGSIS